MKRIRQGNTINFRYSVYRSSGNLEEEEDLTGIEVTTSLQNRLYGTLVDVPFLVEGNVITGQIPGIPHLRTGVYNFCLSYQKDGTDFAVDTDAFQIVDSSSKTGGENTCSHVEVETVELKGVVEFGIVGSGGIDQVQADWKESNTQSKAFIKNKPDLKMVATSGSYNDLSDKPNIPTQLDVPTKTSQLTNDSGFISDPNYVHTDNNYSNEEKEKVAGLQNYDDAALRAALQSEINRATLAEGNLDTAVKKVASDLSNFITGSPDADDIINRWQEVTAFLNGITEDKTLSGMLLDLKKQIDESVTAKLSDYYTSVRVDELFVKKLVGSRLITEEEATKLADLQNYDDTSLVTALGNKVDKVEGKQLSSNDFTSELKTKLEGLTNFPDAPSDGKTYGRKDNTWKEVSTSGPAYTLPVATPTTLGGVKTGSNITNTGGTISIVKENVTDALGYTPVAPVEGKGLFSGSYNDLKDKPSIPVLPEGIVTDANYVHTDNNYTTEDKTKLSGLSNYDDTAIVDRVNTLEGKQPIILDITDWYTLAYKTPNVKVPNLEIPSGWKELLEAGVNNGIRVTFLDQFGNINLYHATIVKHDILGATMYRIYFHFTHPDRVMSFTIEVNYNKDGTPMVGSCILEYVFDISKKADAIEVRKVSDPNGVNDVYAIDPNVFYNFDLVGEIHLSLKFPIPMQSSKYYEHMFQFIAAEDNIPFAVDGVQWINEVPAMKQNWAYQVSIVNNLAVIGGAEYVNV